MKIHSLFLVAGLVLLTSTGCISQAKFLAEKQDMAMQTVLTRAKFDMNCPDATGTVLTQEVVQPAMVGPAVGGVWRAEYTIGVAGCDKRHTYVVVCPDGGEGCFATGPGQFIRE